MKVNNNAQLSEGLVMTILSVPSGRSVGKHSSRPAPYFKTQFELNDEGMKENGFYNSNY